MADCCLLEGLNERQLLAATSVCWVPAWEKIPDIGDKILDGQLINLNELQNKNQNPQKSRTGNITILFNWA